MEEKDLDHILLEQLHSARNRQKLIKKLKKLFKHDPGLNDIEFQNKETIKYFENMIKDKQLLHKKMKTKPKKESDLLSRNPIYEAYKFTFFVSTYGYIAMMDTMKNYLSYFKKDKNEKNS